MYARNAMILGAALAATLSMPVLAAEDQIVICRGNYTINVKLADGRTVPVAISFNAAQAGQTLRLPLEACRDVVRQATEPVEPDAPNRLKVLVVFRSPGGVVIEQLQE